MTGGAVSNSENHYVLQLRVAGPSIGHARIPLADLADVAAGVQKAIQRIGQVIQSGSSQGSGRLQAQVEAATRLEFVGIEDGSALLLVDFPQDIDRALPMLDLGELAIDRLIDGLENVTEPAFELPSDWDDGVLRAISELGKTMQRGHVESVEMVRPNGRSSRFTPSTNEFIASQLERPLPLIERSVLGRLMMVDFDADKRRCRIEPTDGSKVECTYPLDLKEAVRSNATRFVEVKGYATEQNGRIKHLSILELVPLQTPAGVDAESEPKNLSQLIEEQGVQRISEANDLVDPDLWTDDAEVDAFLEWVNNERDAALA